MFLQSGVWCSVVVLAAGDHRLPGQLNTQCPTVAFLTFLHQSICLTARMKYVFPILILLILAVPPSDCFNPSLSPCVLYGYDGNHARLLVLLPPPIYPNPHGWEKPSAIPCVWTGTAPDGSAAPERIRSKHTSLSRAPSQRAAREFMPHGQTLSSTQLSQDAVPASCTSENTTCVRCI